MFKKTNSIQNGEEVKQSEPLSNKLPYGNCQLNANISTLHDPYDIKHIHGLRNRLFNSFNTFASILENALLPPVLKSTKKVQIQIKECVQQSNTNYILKFNSMVSEIKKESINENLHLKKSKTNDLLRKSFQMKLVQCYKLAIDATTLCSKTLEANIYNPIQSKLKMLIKLTSALSSTTGIYLYGALFKKKKEESFDLVQRCKGIARMLDECGYKDTENEAHDNNTLKKLANKALAKPKTQFSNSKHLSMYSHTKPKFGSIYAQGWSKKSLNSTTNQDIEEKYSSNSKIVNGKPLLLKNDIHFSSGNKLFNYNIDNIKTVIQEHPIEEELDINETNNTQVHKKMENNMFINYTKEVTNLPISSKTLKFNKLKTPNNVKLYIIKENVWRKFPIKNVCLSQNGSLILFINPEQVRNNYLYKRQFRQLSLITESQVNTLSNITEMIMEDLINEVLSKIDYSTIVNKIIRMELLE